jgi:4-diphosphocytidyl-2-C-methyl-D-erythritol kinase
MAPAQSTGERVEERARAKVNLYLHVVGRRPDGYHLLDSLVAFADLHDHVAAEPAAGITLGLDGPFAAALAGGDAEPDNLVLRAARALAAHPAGGRAAPPGARLTLTKTLPVAAGIGGGSADAAATLRALVRLWRLGIADADLRTIAVRLGADVPVCLMGRSSLMGGIGEHVTPVGALPSVPAVLANPGRPLPTPAVFAGRDGPFSRPADLPNNIATVDALLDFLLTTRNDLAASATALVPEIGPLLAALAGQPGCRLARMTGSGATVFGLFDRMPDAAQAAAMISRAMPRAWVAATRLGGDTV